MNLAMNHTGKPAYSVPTISQIRALPPNGYTVLSTFAGGGGSSTGYRMAGYKVAWVNEFVAAAASTYSANYPDTVVNTQDVRSLTPEQIREESGMVGKEIDILDGSPPCASFSMAGKREKGWGAVKDYSDTTQRVDDLFFEYARLVRDLQPRVFVAENVKGLVIGTARGYFKLILRELRKCGYRVEARLLNAHFLGVPQRRERIIFVGVREDLGRDPVFPDPLPYTYSLRDALGKGPPPDLHTALTLKHGHKMRLLWDSSARFDGSFSKTHEFLYGKSSSFNHMRQRWSKPASTLCQGSRALYHPDEPRTLSIWEARRLCSFPEDYMISGSPNQQYERVARAVPPVMMYHIAKAIQTQLLDPLRYADRP